MSISFPSADFAPTLSGYTGQGPFRFWCQKVLPIVYDDSLSYYELLNKVVVYLNNIINDVANAETNIAELYNAYLKLQEYVNTYFDNLDVQNEINNKLDDMVSSGEFDNLLSPYVERYMRENPTIRVKSPTIFPIYIGDFICRSNSQIPQCCLKVDDEYYVLCAKPNTNATTDGLGVVRKFITRPEKTVDGETLSAENKEYTEWAHTIELGHANSVAYDEKSGIVYIAPLWDFRNEEYEPTGVKRVVNYLLTYNLDFEFNTITQEVGRELTPANIAGVSYDHVKNKLYCIDFSRNIYERLEGEDGEYNYDGDIPVRTHWKLVSTVDFSDVPIGGYWGGAYNQDFAVHNAIFYISSNRQNIVYGKIEEGSSKISGELLVTPLDSFCRFRLGELEGMEFDANGRLFACDYVGLTGVVADGFVVELPVNQEPFGMTKLGGSLFSVHDGTLQLSDAIKNQFSLRTFEIRAINQLACMELSPNSAMVSIVGDTVEAERVRITQDITLQLNANYTCADFDVFSGELNLNASSTAHILTFLTSSVLIKLERSGSLRFSGSTAVKIATPNISSLYPQLVDIGAWYPTTIVRTVPISVVAGTLFVVGGTCLRRPGVYFGSRCAEIITRNEVVALDIGTVFPCYITDDKTQIKITIPMFKACPSEADTSLTLTGTFNVVCNGSMISHAGSAINFNLRGGTAGPSNNRMTYTVEGQYAGNYLNITVTNTTGTFAVTSGNEVGVIVITGSVGSIKFTD